MAYLIDNFRVHTIICGTLLASFTLTTVVPLGAFDPQPFYNQSVFIYKMEKLVKKLMKLENSKNINKMLDTVMDIKHEIEATCGISIDLNKSINEVKAKLHENDLKISSKKMGNILAVLKRKENNYLKKRSEIMEYMYLDDQYIIESKTTKEDNLDMAEDEEIQAPAQLVFGVSLTLCGVFLMVLPFPMCKPWGERLIQSGIIVCGNCLANKVEEDKQKEKK